MKPLWLLLVGICIILSITLFISSPRVPQYITSNISNISSSSQCTQAAAPVVMKEVVYVNQPGLKRAVCTLLTTEDYVLAARTLGYSIKKTNTSADMVAYIVDTISAKSICLMRDAGWKVIEIIKVVPAPAEPYYRFKDMFTKLLLWNATQYDVITYFDSDMIALLPFDEVFHSPAQFSAVGDYFDHSFTDKFNAGFFVLRPNHDTYNDIMSKIADTSKYDKQQAEQGFLNYYYRYTHARLPYKYNGNLAIYFRARNVWDRISPLVTIHYTLFKPFSEINENDPNVDPIYKVWYKLKNEMLAAESTDCAGL